MVSTYKMKKEGVQLNSAALITRSLQTLVSPNIIGIYTHTGAKELNQLCNDTAVLEIERTIDKDF